MGESDDTFKNLLAGGLIGAGLGALLTGKKEGSILGAIAGAAIMATLKASEEAEKRNFPIYIAENGKLFEVMPDGSRTFIRNIRDNHRNYRSRYTLK